MQTLLASNAKHDSIVLVSNFSLKFEKLDWPKLLTIIGMGSAMTRTPVIQHVAPTSFPRPFQTF